MSPIELTPTEIEDLLTRIRRKQANWRDVDRLADHLNALEDARNITRLLARLEPGVYQVEVIVNRPDPNVPGQRVIWNVRVGGAAADVLSTHTTPGTDGTELVTTTTRRRTDDPQAAWHANARASLDGDA